jgi:hypothetical protein
LKWPTCLTGQYVRSFGGEVDHSNHSGSRRVDQALVDLSK